MWILALDNEFTQQHTTKLVVQAKWFDEAFIVHVFVATESCHNTQRGSTLSDWMQETVSAWYELIYLICICRNVLRVRGSASENI